MTNGGHGNQVKTGPFGGTIHQDKPPPPRGELGTKGGLGAVDIRTNGAGALGGARNKVERSPVGTGGDTGLRGRDGGALGREPLDLRDRRNVGVTHPTH